MDKMPKFKCCICNRVVKGYGNDPWPINNDPKAECCDECNFDYVVPARIIFSKAERRGLREAGNDSRAGN